MPVGSVFLESRWFNTEKIKVPHFDLLAICGNAKAHITHHTYLDDYYEHFKWLVDLSEDYPQLKIGIMHHLNHQWDPKELEIINNYLPKMMDESDIKSIVKTVIDEVGATSMADMGKIMPEVMKLGKGLIDGKLAQKFVQELMDSAAEDL